MHTRFRSRMPLLLRLSLAAAVLLGSAMLPGVSAAQVAAAPAPHALTGLLTPVGTINPLHPPAAQAPLAPSPATKTTIKVNRRIRSSGAARALGTQSLVISAGLEDKPNARLLDNFNGVGSLDSAVTNFGLEFEPPDQGLCVGNGFVLEPVNSAYTFYRLDGSVVAGPINVNVLFGDGLAQFTSDPRCFYDHATNRWFAIILFIADDANSARTDIAVSSSGDPTKSWTIYHLDATDDGTHGTPSHPGCPCLGDQPLLGIDRYNLYVSTNEFSILGPEANGAQLYAIAKSELIAATTAHFVMFENLTMDGNPAFSVQPASSDASADAEYMLNSLDPNGTGDNRVGIWAVANRQAVVHGGVPALSSLIVKSEAYGIPPGAAQKGSTSLLDAGDDRMQQTQFVAGDIWGALDTVVNLPHDATARAGIAWFRVHPDLDGQTLKSVHVAGQGYLAAAGNYLLYPAIQANAAGTAAVAFTLSGPAVYPSAAYSVMADGHKFGKVKIAGQGTGPYDAKATRWGDYSYATLDPARDGFWLATEYIPPKASQTTNGRRNWGTRVFDVDPRDS